MLLCLHLGARKIIALGASQVCNGVDITMCTVQSNVNIITMLVCIWSLPIPILCIFYLCFHLINVLQSNSAIPNTMLQCDMHMTNMT